MRPTHNLLLLICLISIKAFPQFGIHNVQYQDQDLINIGIDESAVTSSSYSFTPASNIKQSFKLRSSDPQAKLVKLERIFFKDYFWAGNNPNIKLNIYEGDVNDNGLLLHTQDFIKDQYIDVETGFLTVEQADLVQITGNELLLELNKQYTFEIEAVSIEQELYSFYLATQDYPDGQCDRGVNDIWFKMQGIVDSDADHSIIYSQANTNEFYLDTFSHEFPNKLIGLYDSEIVELNTNKAGSLSYKIFDENVAKIVETSTNGSVETVKVLGLTEGETIMYVVHNNDTISYSEITVFDKEIIDVSYQYIKYPGESAHQLLTNSSANEIINTINNIYDKANIHINFTNQGVVTHEWDLNGDGASYVSDRSEAFSCSTVVVNPNNFFSNLYVYRFNKTDSYFGGANGGGTSHGYGKTADVPRYGLVSTHLYRTPASLGSTLAHELGHNLGMWHYSSANINYYDVANDFENLMKSGRYSNNIYSFQWNVIHDMLEYRKQQGETYDNRSTTIISNFEDITKLLSEGAFSISPSVNSTANPTLCITQGESVISLNGTMVTPLSLGVAKVKVFYPSTANHKAITKEITITINSITSLQEATVSINIYPNPANNSLRIKSDEVLDEISVFDNQGKQVLQTLNTTRVVVLDIKHLAKGSYTLKAVSNNRITTGRFVKR